MTDPTPVTVENLVPQFKALHVFSGIVAELSDDDIEFWMWEAIQMHAFDSNTTMWAAAHMMSLYMEEMPDGGDGNREIAEQDGGARLLRSQQLGQQSESYERARSSDGGKGREYWGRTEYGRIFLEKEDRVLPAFAFIQ